MKILKDFVNCLLAMDKISKRILLFGYFAFSCSVIGALICLIVYTDRCGDYDTGLYWFGQCMALGKELLGATAVPVFLFEILLVLQGAKNTAE